MTLDAAMALIRATSARMNGLYEKTVFDEWAVVTLGQHKATLLGYLGPRREDFQKNFLNDVRDLRAGLFSAKHDVGNFEFSRHGVGTKVEAFVALGEGTFLVCNNTGKTMDDIAKDPLWLSAQVPFVEMSEAFRSDPLRPARES
jgi:hypothetical protein